VPGPVREAVMPGKHSLVITGDAAFESERGGASRFWVVDGGSAPRVVVAVGTAVEIARQVRLTPAGSRGS
jgi:hypothetical protein